LKPYETVGSDTLRALPHSGGAIETMCVYEPVRLRLTLETRPRGGISSRLTIDSEWAIRGGKEEFRDWVGMDDSW